MATLAGNSIASSYTSLLKLDGNTDSTAAGNGSNAIQVKTGDNDATPLFLNTDRLGIGTANVESLLHVQSDTAAQIQIHNTSSGNAPKFLFDGLVGANADYVLGSLRASWDTHTNIVSEIRFESGVDTTNKDDGQITFWTSPASSTVAERLRIDEVGNVGINCDHPSVPLEIELSGDTGTYFEGGGSGNDASDLRHLTMTASTTSSAGDTHTLNAESGSGVLKFATSGSDRMTINSTGVGIGSSAPDAWSYSTKVLTLSGGSSANNYVAFNLGAYSTSTTGIIGDINFTQFASDGTTGAERAIIRGLNDGATDSVALKFYTTPTGGALAERMIIDSSGQIGIGTVSPDALLDLTSSTGYSNLRLGQNKTNESAQRAGISAQPYLTAEEPTAGMFMYIAGTGSTQDTANLQLGGGHGSFNAVKQIQFYTASDAVTTSGTEVMRLDANSRISLSNNDNNTDNTVFGKSAFNASSDNDSDRNLAIGGSAMGTGTVSGAQNNTAIGYQALTDITSADRNTAVGASVAPNITTGDRNTAIGADALGLSTTGLRNVAIGNLAMYASPADVAVADCVAIGYYALGNATHTTAMNGAVAIGKEALLSLTEGANNIAIGISAGGLITTGTDNTLIGRQSGYQGTYGLTTGDHNTALGSNTFGASANAELTGNYNTAIGSNSMLEARSTASSNTAVGYQTLLNLTDGDSNTAIGTQAMGLGAVSGDNNVAIGAGAGYDITSGHSNVIIGKDAGVNITSGIKNTVVGYSALATATVTAGQDEHVAIGHEALKDCTGDRNTAVGTNAMSAVDNSDNCVAVGYEALKSSGTTDSNIDASTAIGYKALTALTTGGNNTAVGKDALLSLTSGDHNCSFGIGALATEELGQNSIAIGSTALYTQEAGSETGMNNIGIGRNALYNNVTGAKNIAIGTSAGATGTNNFVNGNNNVFIGDSTTGSKAAPTNQIVIGEGATGQADNSVTLGNGDVTAVYMAQDSGARVHAGGLTIKAQSNHILLHDTDEGDANDLFRLEHDGGAFRIDFFDDSASSSTSNLLTVNSAGNVSVLGALSKGSGSFKIDHPLESKKDTHHLVHSFVEAPQADNIYRGKATLSSGSVEINLDTVSGMSEGTFVLLNTDIQCFTSNESDWDAVKGSVSGNILTISCQNTDSTANVSWLVIGERQDDHMKETDWTDENGKVIVEPEKK